MLVPVKEARKLLGKIVKKMTDEEIIELVDNLDAIAIKELKQAHEKQIEEDAMAFAELLYDIYQKKKRITSVQEADNREQKE